MLKLLLLVVGVTAFDQITPRPWETCGYESCVKPSEGVLNVHIVPHSHDDVGWLKTVDQYYYGSRNYIQKAGVQYIIDSVVKELLEDPKRRFIYVETAFFWKWWTHQSARTKRKVHLLVRQGRLQFVGGAWSMNDEAAAHYQTTIDQFTWGLSKLNETFGACALPRVGWQIDPFGHSREFASLLAGMGYDGLFLGRIDYQDKDTRLRTKTMEMLWRGDDDLGSSSDIFTGALYNTYSPPPGFCFDVLCDDEPIIDDPSSPIYNVDAKVTEFIEICKNMSKAYQTKNILITMGEDFQYQDAAMWYTNLDKLIQYANLKAGKEGLKVKLFYSTPNCYLKAVKDAKPILPTKQDDFFPYASDPNSYWTGYFTSRPTTKYFERKANTYLQMAKQLQVLAGLEEHNMFVLNELKSAMGVMQHHDAITGTEKQHVAADYVRLLTAAVDDSLFIPRQAFNKVMQANGTIPPILNFERCPLNESRCDVSETSKQFLVTVYNPLAWSVHEPIRIPVADGSFEVYDPMAETIDSQLVKIPDEIVNLPFRKSRATHELVFVAYLKPISFKTFYVKRSRIVRRDANLKKKRTQEYYDSINNYWKDLRERPFVEIQNIENEDLHAVKIPIAPVVAEEMQAKDINLNVLKDKNQEFNSELVELEKIIRDINKEADYKRRERVDNVYPNLSDDEMRMLSDEPTVINQYDSDVIMKRGNVRVRSDGVITVVLRDGSIDMDPKLLYYPGSVGNNEIAANRSSGAYIFRPNSVEPVKLTIKSHEHIKGDIVEELRIVYQENALHIIRLSSGTNYIESEWMVGPISIDDGVGKEYIVRYDTNLVTNGEFYTDSNGRQLLKRKLNRRPQWNLTLAEPVSGNYYPANEAAITDGKSRLTILTDIPQGASSLHEGSLELMLHRRLLHDDAFGVGEALNETEYGQGLVVRGRHRLIITNKNELATVRKRAIEAHLQPVVFVSNTEQVSFDKWLSLTKCHSWLKQALPDGVHLLTLEPWGDKLLLRLENYLGKDEGGAASVDLSAILANVNVKAVKETVLSANRWREDFEQWKWEADSDFVDSFNKAYGSFDRAPEARKLKKEFRDDGFKISLKPKQIRTFIVDYEYVDA